MRTCRSLVHRSPLHSSLLPRHRDDMRRRGLLYQQTTHNRLGTPSASDVIAKNGAYFSASSRSNIRIVNPTVQTATNRELQHACEHYVNTAPEGNIDYALSVVGMTVLEAQAIPGNGCDSNSRASEIFYSMDRGSTWTQLAWCTFTTGSFCAERHIKRHVRHHTFAAPVSGIVKLRFKISGTTACAPCLGWFSMSIAPTAHTWSFVPAFA